MSFEIFQVETNQYDNPINCYSEEVLKEMSEKGSWKTNFGPAGGPAGVGGGPMPGMVGDKMATPTALLTTAATIGN